MLLARARFAFAGGGGSGASRASAGGSVAAEHSRGARVCRASAARRHCVHAQAEPARVRRLARHLGARARPEWTRGARAVPRRRGHVDALLAAHPLHPPLHRLSAAGETREAVF
eukprot:4383786-Pleurochrysis_carterae.AAC.2